MKAKRLSDGKTIDVYSKSIEHYYDAETNDYYRPDEIEVIVPENKVVEGWLCRDREFDDRLFETDLFFGFCKPKLCEENGYWMGLGEPNFEVPRDQFPSVTCENSPKRVRIEITLIDEKGE